MDTLQLTVLALFYILATGGYALATAGRLWRSKSVAPRVQPAAAIHGSLASLKDETTLQPRPRPPPPAKAEDKSGLIATPLRTPQASLSRRGRLGRFFGSKGPSPSVGEVKRSAPRRGFSLRRRKEVTSGAGPTGEAQLQQKGMKLQAQQAVQVGAPRGEEEPSAIQQAQIQGEDRVLIDSYAVLEPFVRIGISQEPDGSEKYIVFEPRLTKAEAKQLGELREALRHGLEIDVSKFDSSQAVAYLSSKTEDVMKKFGIRVPKISYEKIFYFIERDFLHYGKLDPVMRDPNIEDISCNGPGLPVYVFHRVYESIPTNVTFKDQEELEKFVLRLSYLSGRNLSVSDPVVDASLPDGSRIQMTFGSEITKKGSTFTIRKFKEDPYSVIDLIRFKTITSEIAALLWFALENKSSVLMAGGTASGKSIAGNEPVLIYDRGVPRLVEISNLFNDLAKTGNVTKERGYETVASTNIQTAAFSEDLKVRPFRVHGVIRHPAPRRMSRVRTRTGREATLTGDHSAFTLVDGSVRPYPASQLEPGMFIAVPRTLPDAGPARDTLDLIEAFSEQDCGFYAENAMPYVRKAIGILGEHEVERILRVGHRSFLEQLRKDAMAVRVSSLARLARAAGFAIDPAGMKVRTRSYRKGGVPAVIRVSGELARFLGYWVAEGKYGKGLELYNLDMGVRSDIHRLAKSLFGLEVKDHRTDRTRMSINSRPLEMTFRRVFGLQEGAGRKAIPQLAFEQSNILLGEFLKGYYTGDGSVGRYIEATTKSRMLAEQLLIALARFGIVAQVAPKEVAGVTYYRVAIYGRKNMERFSERLGFLDRARQRRLGAELQRKISPHTNIDTIPGIAPLLKQVLQFKAGPERKQLWNDWHSYWSSSKRIGQQALVSYLEEAGAIGELRNRLLTLAYSEIFWDEVVEVEEIESKEEFVYDLEVPGAQNFVGGRGGLFLHNTTTINCLALFIRPDMKIVTIEDTPEINLAHKNWIQSVSRQGFAGMGEVTLYDLLRAALRQRPDFIIPGEVRGEEAQTMFQAISTGHAGMSSIHADSIAAVFHRLTNPPMNIPRTLIPALNFVLLQARVTVGGKAGRRILSVTEVVGLDTRSSELITNEVYRFNQDTDTYTYSGRSYMLEKLAKLKGLTNDEVRQELATRAHILQWMADKGMRKYREVASVIQRYYTDKPSLLAEMGGVAL